MVVGGVLLYPNFPQDLALLSAARAIVCVAAGTGLNKNTAPAAKTITPCNETKPWHSIDILGMRKPAFEKTFLSLQ